MQLVLHSGVHFTDEELLVKCLLRNADSLAKRGVAIPGPGKYRRLIRDTLNAMAKNPASPDARDILLDAVLDEGEAKRLILSDANFFRTPATAVEKGVMYPAAAERLMYMRELFPHDEIELFMAIRNPASHLPNMFLKAKDQTPAGFWGGQDPRDILWSNTIRMISQFCPDITISVWRCEDAAMVWPEILRDMAGLATDDKIVGGFDMLSTVMEKEGMKRFRSFLRQYPVVTDEQKRRAMAIFLDKYGKDREKEEDLVRRGWPEALVDDISELYDQDIEVIAEIPNVDVIQP